MPLGFLFSGITGPLTITLIASLAGFCGVHALEKRGEEKANARYERQNDRENARLHKRLTATHKKLQSDYADVTAQYNALEDKYQGLQDKLAAYAEGDVKDGECSPICKNPQWLMDALNQ